MAFVALYAPFSMFRPRAPHPVHVTSLDPAALTLGILAALLLFVLRAGIVTTLGVSAVASLLLALLG